MTNEILKLLSKSIDQGNKINKETFEAIPKGVEDPR